MRALLLILLLAGCSSLPIPGLSLGGGPNVAANVNAGKTNTQTVGITRVVDQSAKDADHIEQSSDTVQLKADTVDTVNNGLSTFQLIALLLWTLLLWQLPSPSQMGGWINRKVFRRV